MSSIQVLHHFLSFERLKIVGDKLWKLGIRQIPFIRNFFWRYLSLFTGRFRNLNHRSPLLDNVDCFSKFPTSFWSKSEKRSQSLPLPSHQSVERQESQPGQSTSKAVVPYSAMPTDTDDVKMPPLTSSNVITGTGGDHNLNQTPGLSTEISMLVGVTSDEFERYDRNFQSKMIHPDSFMIQPLDMTFTERPVPPNPWVAYTHPDGTAYFLDNSRTIPILTDVWIYDEAFKDRLEDYITQIFSYIEKYQIQIPLETYLVLEFRNKGRCGYYFVNHPKQSLFWLDEFDGMDFLYEVRVQYTPSLIDQQMKSLYWLHNHLFPNIPNILPSAGISEVKDILIHAVGDSLTSDRSLALYSPDVLQKMLDLVNIIQAQDEPGAGSIAIISRFLQNFYNARFIHLHGQKMARLNRDQSIHPEKQRTYLMTVMSPLLLYGAEVYLRKLQETTVDCHVNKPVWKNVLGLFTDEWKEFTLYATVLLNANIAFLAIQSVDSSSVIGHRSNAQIASYSSAVTSLGAIVLGLILVREHNTSSLNPSFVANRSASVYGLETLALMYSLPYALLMWGAVFFLVAFSLMCFSSHDKAVMVMISITWFMLCSFFLWCISVSYERWPLTHLQPLRHLGWFKNLIMEGIIAGKGKIMHMADSDKHVSFSLPV